MNLLKNAVVDKKLYKVVYLPVENYQREYAAKKKIAGQLQKEGFFCVLARKEVITTALKANLVFPGVFFAKDLIPGSSAVIKKISGRGHRIIAHDEEGLVQFSWKDYTKRRCARDLYSYIDHLFCWGINQRNAVLEYDLGFSSDDLSIVGHPRADIAASMRPLQGGRPSKIVFSLKFGDVNHKHGQQFWLFNQCRMSNDRSHKFREYTKRRLQYKNRLLKKYISLIKKTIENFPRVEIIIRPHPSEDPGFWRREFRKYPAVTVRNKKPITSEFFEPVLLIHTGCTTGIEAYLAGCYVISYEPIDNSEFEIELPGRFGIKTQSDEAVISLVMYSLDYGFAPSSWSEVSDSLRYDLEISKNKPSVSKIGAVVKDKYSGSRALTLWQKMWVILALALLGSLHLFRKWYSWFAKRLIFTFAPRDIS